MVPIYGRLPYKNGKKDDALLSRPSGLAMCLKHAMPFKRTWTCWMSQRCKKTAEAMPFKPNVMVLKTLLGACRVCGDVELAVDMARPEGRCAAVDGLMHVFYFGQQAFEMGWVTFDTQPTREFNMGCHQNGCICKLEPTREFSRGSHQNGCICKLVAALNEQHDFTTIHNMMKLFVHCF